MRCDAKPIMPSLIKACLCAALLLATLASTALAEMRDWTDQQGRSFRGELYSTEGDAVKVRRESDFRVFDIRIDQLSEADQLWLKEQSKPATPATPPPAAPPPDYLYPDKVLDRSLIPTYDQSDFRNRGTCGPSAIMNFMMWWGEHLYPEILASGSLETKAKWTMQRLIRTCDTSGGTHNHEMEKGLLEYFERYAPEYSADIEWQNWPDNEWLSQAAQGNNLVVLTLGYYNDPQNYRREGGHFVSLVSSEGDTSIVHTWGKIYTVTLMPIKRSTGTKEISEGVYQRVFQTVYQAYRNPLEGEDPDRAGLWNGHIGLIETAMVARIRRATDEEIAERDKKR